MQLAVATNVIEGTKTSSPGPISKACRIKCNAAVQELTASESSALCRRAKANSNSRTLSPIVIQPLSTTSERAAFSSIPRMGFDTNSTGILPLAGPGLSAGFGQPDAARRRLQQAG